MLPSHPFDLVGRAAATVALAVSTGLGAALDRMVIAAEICKGFICCCNSYCIDSHTRSGMYRCTVAVNAKLFAYIVALAIGLVAATDAELVVVFIAALLIQLLLFVTATDAKYDSTKCM